MNSPLTTFGSRLEHLRISLKMNKQEFANALDVPAASFTRYENNSVKPGLDFFERIFDAGQKIGTMINLNWLIGGFGEMLIDLKEIEQDMNQEIPEKTSNLLMQAFLLGYQDDSFDELDKMIEQYIVRSTFRKKFTFPQSTSFFSSLYWHFERLKTLRLFARALKDHKNNQKIIVPEFAKEILMTAIATYNLTLIDKFDNLITEKQRKLAMSIVEDFTSVECFAILSDVDMAIEILEDEKLTSLDRFHIPLLSSPVKL